MTRPSDATGATAVLLFCAAIIAAMVALWCAGYAAGREVGVKAGRVTCAGVQW